MALSLENKVSTSKSWSHRAFSFLSRSLLSVSLLAAGCGTTEVGRRYVGTTWEKSNKPPREEVISTRHEEGESRIKQGLGDLIVNYDAGLIGIPVSETPTRYVREVQTGQKRYLLREVEEEEVEYERPRSKTPCSIGQVLLGSSVFLLPTGLLMQGEDETRQGVGKFFIGLGTLSLLPSLPLMLYGCTRETRTRTETHPTGREKPAEPEDYTAAGDFKAVAGGTRPASSGSLSLSGFLQGIVPIRNGHAVLPILPPGNSLVFANNQNNAARSVDLSWVTSPCREGLAEFVSSNAQPTTMQWAAQTRPPAGEEQRYETDQRTYELRAYKIPSREEIIRYVVDQHINSRIRQATILYKDKKSRYPVHNVEVSFQPINVLSPAVLASLCFKKERKDRAVAQRMISSYTYAPFKVRVNGEYSFPVFTPSVFRVQTVHPNYRYNDGKMGFVTGNLEWEVLMAE